MKNLLLIILFFILTSSMCKPNIYSSKKKRRIKSDYGLLYNKEQKKRIDEVQKPRVYKRTKGWGF